jgi:hypothetical protein
MIIIVENSNKLQKTRFWKEKSFENVVTFGPIALITLLSYKNILLFHVTLIN